MKPTKVICGDCHKEFTRLVFDNCPWCAAKEMNNQTIILERRKKKRLRQERRDEIKAGVVVALLLGLMVISFMSELGNTP